MAVACHRTCLDAMGASLTFARGRSAEEMTRCHLAFVVCQMDLAGQAKVWEEQCQADCVVIRASVFSLSFPIMRSDLHALANVHGGGTSVQEVLLIFDDSSEGLQQRCGFSTLYGLRHQCGIF